MSSNGKNLQAKRKTARAKPKTKRVVITQTTTAAPQQRKRVRARRKKAAVAVSAPGKVSGQGAYFGDLGATAGSYLGKRAGGFLDTVFGLGDYKVRRNSLVNPGSVVVNANTPPRVVNAKKGEATVVNHREYIGDLSSGTFVPDTTSTAFNMLRYQINPGNSDLFPWLSSQADGYQEYEVHGMLVELVTEASEVSTNLSMGIMAMAAEYNPLAPSPVSKLEMLELEYASSCKTSQTLIMPIECARAYDGLTHLLVDVNEDYDGTDARNFDLGAIFIASVGQPAENAKIAEIWVTYEMWFYKPRLPRGLSAASLHMQLSGCSSADPLTDALVMPGSTEGFTVTNGDTLHFPPGTRNWFVLFWWTGPDLATTDAYEFVCDSCTVDLAMFSTYNFGNDTSAEAFVETASAATPTKLMQALIVSCHGSGIASVQLTGGGLISGSYGDVFAFALSPSMVTKSLSTLVSRVTTGRLNQRSGRVDQYIDPNRMMRRRLTRTAPARHDPPAVTRALSSSPPAPSAPADVPKVVEKRRSREMAQLAALLTDPATMQSLRTYLECGKSETSSSSSDDGTRSTAK
jgi:hypothetical protein